MKLTVIIPNFNGKSFLKPCLDSLRRQSFRDFQVIVVDNGSSDGSSSFIADTYPEVSVISLSQNLGFARASNIGIRSCRTPYVMLLNNDTVLSRHCLFHLIKTLEQDPLAFSVSPHILTMDIPALTDTSGDFYTLFGYAFCRGQGMKPLHHRKKSIFTGCGCAVIYRRSLLAHTGLLDPSFFAYLEDVDLGFRAHMLGYRNLYCPQAFVRHIGSGTTGKKYSSFKVYHSARNNVWLIRKNFSFFQKLIHAPFLFVGTLAKYFYFRRIHLHGSYLRGCLDGLRFSMQSRRNIRPSLRTFVRTEPWILYGSLLYLSQLTRRLRKKNNGKGSEEV